VRNVGNGIFADGAGRPKSNPHGGCYSSERLGLIVAEMINLEMRSESRRPSASSCGSRGGFTSKLRCLADALGRPLAFHLTVGEAADCKAYDALISLPERTPDALLATRATMRTPSVPTLQNGRLVHLATARYWLKFVHAA